MFVKLLRENGLFIYANKNHVVYVEPSQTGTGTNVILTSVSFYSPQSIEEVLNLINN